MHHVRITPIDIGRRIALGFQVELPGTRLLAISTGRGYIMCGALDVNLLDTRLAERRVVAGRALGVSSLPQLLTQPLSGITAAAYELGVRTGMTGRDALHLMF